jgi:membrane-associated phospholipid phosphatase
LVLACSSGCTGTGGSWSAHWPEPGRWSEAAKAAGKDPHTWAPLLGAAAFAATDWDDEVSESAVRSTSIFSDPQGSSSDLRDAAAAAYIVSALAAPSDTAADKASGFAVGFGATVATAAVANGLKDLTGRQRPVDDNDQSFPSGHASRASVLSNLARYNLNAIDMAGWQRHTLNAGLYGIAIGAGWARVEAGKHYPSDVLAGYALGSFMARFFQEAFMQGGARVAFVPVERGGVLTVSLPLR